MRRCVMFLNVAMMLSLVASASLMIAIVSVGIQTIEITLLTLVVSCIAPVILVFSKQFTKNIWLQGIITGVGLVFCALGPIINLRLVILAGREATDVLLNDGLTVALLFSGLFYALKRIIYPTDMS